MKQRYNDYRLPIHPFAFEVSFNFNLQSQSRGSLFTGTWLKRHEELEYGLRFDDNVQYACITVHIRHQVYLDNVVMVFWTLLRLF